MSIVQVQGLGVPERSEIMIVQPFKG